MFDNALEILEIGPECNERFVDCDRVPEMANLDISISGVSNLAGHYRVGRKRYVSHVLFYTVDGAITLHTDHGTQVVGKGNLITLPANQAYLLELNEPSWTMVWFALDDTPKWRNLCINRPTVVNCDSNRQIFHLLSLIYYERDSALRKPALQQLEYYLNETLCAPLPDTFETLRINQLLRDIEKRLHNAWTVKEMSALIQYSPPHLHRLFQKRFQRSPIQQLIYLRMERAKYLLVHTTWTIENIAEQVGYADVFNFSKRFKKSVGVPPGNYRKVHTNKRQLDFN